MYPQLVEVLHCKDEDGTAPGIFDIPRSFCVLKVGEDLEEEIGMMFIKKEIR